jgi:hypothetical protein
LLLSSTNHEQSATTKISSIYHLNIYIYIISLFRDDDDDADGDDSGLLMSVNGYYWKLI